ncbi:MAG: glycosyltransferase family 2 protein [Candidatus Wallbacteria bacterium]
MNPLKLSIITVTYNSKKYVEQTIKSVIDQNYGNVEYIIIDGVSTDGTLDIIKKYEKNISKIICEPDNGISDALNKGIKNACGDIIGIIHSDDWYEPKIFNDVIEIFKNTNADVVCGKVLYWLDEKPYYIFNSTPENLEYDMTVNHPSVFVKKSVYDRLGGFFGKYKYAMDYDLILRFKLNGCKFVSIDKILANMRLNGISDKNWFKTIFENYTIKTKNGISSYKAFTYMVFQTIRMCTSRLLEKVGLKFIVSFYRKYFSVLKKEKFK